VTPPEPSMSEMRSPRLLEILRHREADLLTDWIARQMETVSGRSDLISEEQVRQQSREFFTAFAAALESGATADLVDPRWDRVRALLKSVSEMRARQGFTPSETATFVFSLKQPLFAELGRHLKSADELARETWATNLVLDALGLHTTELYQKSREAIIGRQQNEMLELSTPVVTLWKGVLALPLIGTLDSERTQVVMESLLQRIVDTGSTIAILDITGVPTVDTLVAQHLLKTVAAARLMGADCIISGIRPQIAQTIVHLGVDLNSVTTKATLADAFAVALKRLGLGVREVTPPGPARPTPTEA
jgi:rsbT co-antagonist protein RsbR